MMTTTYIFNIEGVLKALPFVLSEKTAKVARAYTVSNPQAQCLP